MARKRNQRWEQRRLRLARNHQWRAQPGYNVFVANRGEVRFDVPESWVMTDGESAIEFRDKAPPDDDCILQLTIFHLHPQVDWSGLPLAQLFADITGRPHAERTHDITYGEVHYEKREDCELAWREGHGVEEHEGRGRATVTRTCLARGGTVMPLFTMDFWQDDYDRFAPVWDTILASLRLGDMVADPRTGQVTRLDARRN